MRRSLDIDQLANMYSIRPPLYFVKVDVQACFDTIDQRKLLEILQRIIREVGSLVFYTNAFKLERRMAT